MIVRIKSWIYRIVSPSVFALLFTLKNIIFRTKLRCSYKKNERLFIVRQGSQLRYASAKSRVFMYANSFETRAKTLANSYLLGELKFDANAMVVDCGANVGDFYFALKQVCAKNFRYHAFEPNPADFSCAIRNIPLESNDIRVENIALWNRNCVLDFYVDTEHASSSLIEPTRHTSILKVRASRLDCLFKTEDIFLLKLEAEGAEPEVLEGAEGLLHKIRFIVADVGPERGKLEEEARDQVVSYLTCRNFSILKENPGHRKTILFKNNIFEENYS